MTHCDDNVLNTVLCSTHRNRFSMVAQTKHAEMKKKDILDRINC